MNSDAGPHGTGAREQRWLPAEPERSGRARSGGRENAYCASCTEQRSDQRVTETARDGRMQIGRKADGW